MEQEILENTKMLLKISDSENDALLEFLIKDTLDAVMEYCRIDIIPRQLYGLIAQMSADSFRLQACNAGGNEVKSITEGERRVEFKDGKSAGEVFANYAARLKPFMNKSARLISDTEACDGKG